MDGFTGESGLFGISGHRQAAWLGYLGLHALQHRADGAAGLVASDGDLLRYSGGLGFVQEVFEGTDLQALPGDVAVGQVHGGDGQLPLLARYRGGQVALAMSGRFTNGSGLRQKLKSGGALFTTRTDAEVLLHLVATSTQRTLVNRLVDALWRVEGAFNVLLCSEDRLIAVRDPYGFRPLVLGRFEGATLVATEDGPIRFLGGEVLREVLPGEMVIVDARGITSVSPFASRTRASCVREYVQLAAEDAHVFGQPVYPLRVALGERLGKEQPCADADVVVGVPGSSMPAALGYSRITGLPLRDGMLRAPFTGRRYVEPPRELEDFGARLRFTPVPAVVDQRRVVLVVGELGTGSEVQKIVRLLMRAGAAQVHLRVASPPTRTSCPYGVISPVEDELAASRFDGQAQLGDWLGVASVGFLDERSLHAISGDRVDGTRLHCDACFSRDFPVAPVEADDQIPLFGAE